MTGMKICNNNNRCAVILGDDCGTAQVRASGLAVYGYGCFLLLFLHVLRKIALIQDALYFALFS